MAKPRVTITGEVHIIRDISTKMRKKTVDQQSNHGSLITTCFTFHFALQLKQKKNKYNLVHQTQNRNAKMNQKGMSIERNMYHLYLKK